MEDENQQEEKPKSKTEEEGKGILAQIREERDLLTKEREAAAKQTAELRELRSVELLSGRADKASDEKEEEKEETPVEYKNRIIRGELKEDEWK